MTTKIKNVYTTLLLTSILGVGLSLGGLFIVKAALADAPPPPIDISSVAPIANINVANGTLLGSIGLPATTSVVLVDGTTTPLAVVWDGGLPPYDGTTAGTYVFTGTLTLTSDIINSSSTPALVDVVVAAPIIIPTLPSVNLLSAGNFTILSKTGITDANSSAITGNIGSSPISGTAILVPCSEVVGTIYSVDAAGPLPCRVTDSSLLTAAVSDMETAYTNAAGLTNPTATELGSGEIGGLTIAPGLYKWSTDVMISANVTLSGSASDVWVFQIGGNLGIASGGSVPAGTKVILTGGAKAENVFWQVGGVSGATLGTYSTFSGNILAAKQIVIQSGATLKGRALAQTQVTINGNAISDPTIDIIVVATNTPPIITILGANPLSITVNSVFTDPGATATDTEDGNVTSNITASSSVSTTTIGSYAVTYAVTDSGGLTSTTTRTVNVIASTGGGGGNLGGGGGGGGGGSNISYFGGGSSSGSSGNNIQTIQSIATINTPTACSLLSSYLKYGSVNDPAEVVKLQSFLLHIEGYNVDVNGTFDLKTLASVNDFQTRYLATVMGPWEASRSSGYVYITTRKKLNEISCNAAFVISPNEQAIIDAYKAGQKGLTTTPASTPSTPLTPNPDISTSSPEIGLIKTPPSNTENTASVINAPASGGFWNFLKGLFAR